MVAIEDDVATEPRGDSATPQPCLRSYEADDRRCRLTLDNDGVSAVIEGVVTTRKYGDYVVQIAPVSSGCKTHISVPAELVTKVETIEEVK